ncbi:MAG: alkaline phosphatase [Saprospiraceae bacterium]
MRLFLLLLALIFSSCAANRKAEIDYYNVQFAEKPRNIILLIGDGMALPQVSAHIYWQGVGKTIFEKFKVVGFHKSYAYNDLVTDSAAGATAFACGHKTTNGAIGVLPPDNHPCPTILEQLSEEGYATGMVVTCTATHATPACFIAHRELRAFTDEIALDYLKTPFDCLIAGGEKNFDERYDKLNLVDSFKTKGYMVKRGTNLKNLPLDGSKPFVVFTDDREPPTASGGRKYLPEASKKACEYLDKRSDKGFFLMVEGSQIDWAGHANDRNWLRSEMEDFDRTIRKVLEFAAKDGETLVIVTGDHECGGLALTKSDSRKEFKPVFSTRLHTAALVPVYAYGPKAELFSGTYENTDIYWKMRKALE